jgi:hypothetical protein
MPGETGLRVVGLLEKALTASDPTVALRALTALRGELDALERQRVARALDDGTPFSAIARPLGITRQAAHRRYRDLNKTRTLSEEARVALLHARDEATRHGSYCIDSRHLLLALAAGGAVQLDVDRARRSLAPPAITARTPTGLDPQLYGRLARCAGAIGPPELLAVALTDARTRALHDRFRGLS